MLTSCGIGREQHHEQHEHARGEGPFFLLLYCHAVLAPFPNRPWGLNIKIRISSRYAAAGDRSFDTNVATSASTMPHSRPLATAPPMLPRAPITITTMAMDLNVVAHGGVDKVDRREEQTRDGGKRGAEGEGEAIDPGGVDAEALRHHGIFRGRPHGAPEICPF